MIKLIIALSNRFSFVDRWLIQLVEAYGFQDRQEKKKLTALDICTRDIQRVNAFERSGEKKKLRIVHQPRG